MTLLESVVALVILGLSAVGFLEVFQGASRSTTDAQAWVTAVAYAEEGVEAAKIGGAAIAESQRAAAPAGMSRRIELQPWRGRVADVVVTVTFPGGQHFALHRLVTR